MVVWHGVTSAVDISRFFPSTLDQDCSWNTLRQSMFADLIRCNAFVYNAFVRMIGFCGMMRWRSTFRAKATLPWQQRPKPAKIEVIKKMPSQKTLYNWGRSWVTSITAEYLLKACASYENPSTDCSKMTSHLAGHPNVIELFSVPNRFHHRVYYSLTTTLDRK